MQELERAGPGERTARKRDGGAADALPTALFLIHDLVPGGAERVYLEYLKGISAFRTIPVLVRPRGALALELPVDRPWYHLERGGTQGFGVGEGGDWSEVTPNTIRKSAVHEAISLLAQARRLRRIALHEGAGLVCTFLHKSHAIALVAKVLHPALSVVVNIHEQPRQHVATHFNATRGRLMAGLYRWALPRADGVVAVAQGVREELEASYGVPPGLIDVVPNPLDLEGLHARAATGPRPTDLPGSGGPLLVAVGRLEHIKGFDLLIEAVRQVRATMPLRLALIGDGTQRSALAAQISAADLNDCVSLLGHRAEPIPYIATADLLVLPSRTEAWPTVIGEALAVGTPVLATRCSPGVVEFLCGGSCGALTDAGSAEELAAGIRDLLRDPEALEGLAAAGAKRAEQFERESILAQYEGILLKAKRTASWVAP